MKTVQFILFVCNVFWYMLPPLPTLTLDAFLLQGIPFSINKNGFQFHGACFSEVWKRLDFFELSRVCVYCAIAEMAGNIQNRVMCI